MSTRKCPVPGSGHGVHPEGSTQYKKCKEDAKRIEASNQRARLQEHERAQAQRTRHAEIAEQQFFDRLLGTPPTDTDALDSARPVEQPLDGLKAQESIAEKMAQLAHRPPDTKSDSPDYEM